MKYRLPPLTSTECVLGSDFYCQRRDPEHGHARRSLEASGPITRSWACPAADAARAEHGQGAIHRLRAALIEETP